MINKEINRLQGLSVRTLSRIAEVEGEIKALELQIDNERKKIELLESLHMKEDKRLKDKIESVYHHDFEIQKSQIKLRHLTGQEQDHSVLEKKEKTIEELEKCLKEKNELLKLLQSQITTLEVN